MSAPATFVYDGDCGFCTRFAGWLAPRAHDVDVVAVQHLPSLDEWQLTADDVRVSSWYVDAGGRRRGRHLGIAAALESTGGPWRAVGRVLRSRGVAPVAGVVYDWVARNRHRMPGGTPTCRMKENPDDAR